MKADTDAVDIAKVDDTKPANSASTRKLDPGLMAHRLSFRLRGLLGLLGERVLAAFAPFGLRSGSFTAMALIKANPGCSQIELAREGGLDKSSLVALLNDLEERGYAIRARSTRDKRRSNLFVTPEGEKVMHEMFEAAMKTEASLREAFTPDEMQLFFAFLERAFVILASEDRGKD